MYCNREIGGRIFYRKQIIFVIEGKKEMVPKIFISYSVESDEHNKRVQDFANLLKRKGMNVLIFDDMKLGERYEAFMENIDRSDFVLFICTPQYKKRADARDGGIGKEWNIITASVVKQCDELKFIPVLFSGGWDTSLPVWAMGKKGIDYRNESESEFELLVTTIDEYVEMESLEVLGEETYGEHADYDETIPKKYMDIYSDDGSVEEVEVIISFEIKATKKEYIVYTKGEKDRRGNLTVYVSNVDRTSGEPNLLGIETEEEWKMIKEILRELGKDDGDNDD